MLNVRRKRRVTHGVQSLVERGTRSGEARDALAVARVGAPVDNFGRKGHVALGVTEIDDGTATRFQTFARTNEHFPNGLLVAAERAIGAFGCHIGVGRGTHALAKQKHFGLPARTAFGAQKARRHDARLVGHEHVARLEVFNNVAEDAVFQLARFAIHHEHLARIAHRRRLLGDAVLRKVVIKIVSFHKFRRSIRTAKRLAAARAPDGAFRVQPSARVPKYASPRLRPNCTRQSRARCRSCDSSRFAVSSFIASGASPASSHHGRQSPAR